MTTIGYTANRCSVMGTGGGGTKKANQKLARPIG